MNSVPPPPPPPPPPTPPPNTPAALLAKRSWRLKNSRWILFPLLSFGLLTWVGFAYVGTKARRPQWWAPAIAYLLPVLGSLTFPGDSTGFDVSMTVLVVGAWIGGSAHAFLINRSWLTWRAHNTTPWYAETLAAPQATAPSAPPPAAPQATGLPPSLNVDPAEYFNQGPAAQLSGQNPTTVPEQHPMDSETANQPPRQPVDVNTATAADFATVLGLSTAQAQAALDVRAQRGRFATVDDFAAAAGLAPHELVRLRPWLACSPQRSTHPRGGRVVDI